MIAGDAAHQMPPFAGQGMCSGLRDAANLAWKLDLVLYGQAHQALLDTYTTERRQDVQHAIQQSLFLGGIICQTDPAAAAERDKSMIAERRSRGDGNVLDKACLRWCKLLGIRLLRITGDHTADGPADVVDLDGVYLSRLAGSGQTALLVRPDFYIFGGAADPGELSRLITVLCNKLTRSPTRHGLLTEEVIVSDYVVSSFRGPRRSWAPSAG